MSYSRRLAVYLAGTVAAFSAALCLILPTVPGSEFPLMNAVSIKSGAFATAPTSFSDPGLVQDPAQYDGNTSSGGASASTGNLFVIWDLGSVTTLTAGEMWFSTTGAATGTILISDDGASFGATTATAFSGSTFGLTYSARYVMFQLGNAPNNIFETALFDSLGNPIGGPVAPATCPDPVFDSATASTITFFIDTLPVGATSFSIERAPDVSGSAGSYSTIDTSAGTTNYTDTGLTSGTLYWYRLIATNGAGSTAGNGVRMRATIDYTETGRAIGPLFVLAGGDGGRAFTDTGRATDLRIITGADSGFPLIETGRGSVYPVITGAFDGRAYAETGTAMGPLTVLTGRTDQYNAGEAGRGTVATILTGQASGGSSAFGETPGVVVFVRPGGSSSMTRTELGKALANIIVTVAATVSSAARRELSRSVLLSVLTGRTDHAARRDLLRPIPIFVLDGRQGGLTFSEARGSALLVTTAATVQRYRIGETGRGSLLTVLTGETDHAARRDRAGTVLLVTPGATFHLAAIQHPGTVIKVLTGASTGSARRDTGRGLVGNVTTGEHDTRQNHETGRSLGPITVSTGANSGRRYQESGRGSLVLVRIGETDHAALRDAAGEGISVITGTGTQHRYNEPGRGVLVRVVCGEGDLQYGDLVEIIGDRTGGPLCGTAGGDVLIGTAIW